MIRPRFRQLQGQRGFYLIGLLMVLVIMLILAGNQVGKKAQNVKRPISKSKEAACSLNRSAFLTNVRMWSMSHMGEKPTRENLERDGVQIPGCPEGGNWTLSQDGQTVYCSIHAPAPTPVPKRQPQAPQTQPREE